MAYYQYYVTAPTGVISIPIAGISLETYLPYQSDLILKKPWYFSISLTDGTTTVSLDQNVHQDKFTGDFGKRGTYLLTFPTVGTDNFTKLLKLCSATSEGKIVSLVIDGKQEKTTFYSEQTVQVATTIKLYCSKLNPDKVSIDIVNHSVNGSTTALFDKGLSYITGTVKVPKSDYYTAKTVKINGVNIDGESIINLTLNGDYYTGEFTSKAFDTSGEYIISATVTTANNVTKTATQSITVNRYISPTLTISEFYRNDTDGTKLLPKNAKKDELYNTTLNASVLPCANTELTSYTQKVVIDVENTKTETAISDNCVTFTGNSLTMAQTNALIHDEYGLLITAWAELIVTVTDNTGTETSLSATLGTQDTTFHLMEGGKGAKFGGFATKENTLDCAWKLNVDNEIETNTKVTTPALNLNGTEVTGVGSTETNVAKGNHSHGAINSDGTFKGTAEGFMTVSNDNADKNKMVLSSRAIAGTDLPAGLAENMGKRVDEKIQSQTGYPLTANTTTNTIGDKDKNLCFANHTHALLTDQNVITFYNDTWSMDEGIQQNTLASVYYVEQVKKNLESALISYYGSKGKDVLTAILDYWKQKVKDSSKFDTIIDQIFKAVANSDIFNATLDAMATFWANIIEGIFKDT